MATPKPAPPDAAQDLSYAVLDQNYNAALDYDSFVSFKLQNATRISTFPVEQGAFASYNKSASPYKITVRLALSGDPARRRAFVHKLESLMKGIDLLMIATPDATYFNANLVSYDYSRDAKNNGWGRVVADLHFEEVRIVALQYSSTTVKNPGAAKKSNTGKVAPTDYALNGVLKTVLGYIGLFGG